MRLRSSSEENFLEGSNAWKPGFAPANPNAL
jgi:hypothetical protein